MGKPPIVAITPFFDRDHAKPRDRPRNRLGKTPAETANHGHHALIGQRCRQNPRQRATNWGKIPAKPPIMAMWLYSTAMSPKAATLRHELGKIPEETAIHGHLALYGPRSRPSQRQHATRWEKFLRNRQSWRFPRTAAIGSAKQSGLANQSGLVKQSGMTPVVGAIDDKKPQLRVSSFPAKGDIRH